MKEGVRKRQANQKDFCNGIQEQNDVEIISHLQQQISDMENREVKTLSALDQLKEHLSQRDEYLQLLTDELKTKNLEIEQKNQHLFEYEKMLSDSKETIHQLEDQVKSANIKIKSLEKTLEENRLSMEQLEISQQSSLVALQEKLFQKEKELQSLQKGLAGQLQIPKVADYCNDIKCLASLDNFPRQEDIAEIQTKISEEYAHLRDQYHNLCDSFEIAKEQAASAELSNKELRIKLAAKNEELGKLKQQFLEYQKAKIDAISEAIAILHQNEEKRRNLLTINSRWPTSLSANINFIVTKDS